MAKKDAAQILLGGVLAAETKKEGNQLLLVSLVGLVISLAGIIPAKIETLGIEFSTKDQQTLRVALAAVVGYFLVGFLIHGTVNYLQCISSFRGAQANEFFAILEARRILASRFVKEGLRRDMPGFADLLREAEEHQARQIGLPYRIWSTVTLCFDFFVPVALGVWAVVALIVIPA